MIDHWNDTLVMGWAHICSQIQDTSIYIGSRAQIVSITGQVDILIYTITIMLTENGLWMSPRKKSAFKKIKRINKNGFFYN